MPSSSQNITNPPSPSNTAEITTTADEKLFTYLKNVVNKKGKWLDFQTKCADPSLRAENDPDYERRGKRESNRAVIEAYRVLKEIKDQMHEEKNALAENKKTLKVLQEKFNAGEQSVIGDYKKARRIVAGQKSMLDKTLNEATEEYPHAIVRVYD